jgi:hypothetical protein
VETIRTFQQKAQPTIDAKTKVSVTSLMAAMAVTVVSALGKKCLLVLDAYFAVGPVFAILKQAIDAAGRPLVHIVTRAKNNVVAFTEAPPKTGGRGRPRIYGQRLKLIELFESQSQFFEQAQIELYGQMKQVCFLCLDLYWKPVADKVRFVLVTHGPDRFILIGSDLTLSARDMILAYSYRFKIEVSFKVLKHLMGIFFYRF